MKGTLYLPCIFRDTCNEIHMGLKKNRSQGGSMTCARRGREIRIMVADSLRSSSSPWLYFLPTRHPSLPQETKKSPLRHHERAGPGSGSTQIRERKIRPGLHVSKVPSGLSASPRCPGGLDPWATEPSMSSEASLPEAGTGSYVFVSRQARNTRLLAKKDYLMLYYIYIGNIIKYG